MESFQLISGSAKVFATMTGHHAIEVNFSFSLNNPSFIQILF
jgi:hypothetical protein